MFSSQDNIVSETNDALAPLMMKKISALNQIKIKNVRIIEHNIKEINNFMPKYRGNTHSQPYHLGNMVVEVNVGNISKPIKVDVALAVFYDKIDNYQLNST